MGKGQFSDSTKSKVRDVSSDLSTSSLWVWLKVGDVMSKDVVTICPDESVVSAAKIISENNISCIVVVDKVRAAGILTETDFLKRVVGKEKDFDKVKVGDVMCSPVESIAADLSIFEASKIMAEKHVKRLPILEEGRLVGIITQTDLIRVSASYGMWRDVSEIMSKDVAGIQSKATVVEATGVMTGRNISCIVVLEGDEVVGVFTEKDLLKRVVALQKDPAYIRMEELMSSPVMTVPPACSLFNASRLMVK